MASEGVVVREESTVTFFHASFFDYAFARGFIGQDGDLVDWLKANGQDLFRRSQTRQVLEFLRDDDSDEVYLETLTRLLGDGSVRFHLKRLALDWLGQLTDPREEEWQVLEALNERLQPHAFGAIRNSVHWFDLLDRLGVLQDWLTSGREDDRGRAISLLQMPSVRRDRSSSAARLLRPLRDGSEAEKQSLLAVMSLDAAHHSREMMNLFLQLVDDGTLDEARGLAMNRDWWHVLYGMSTAKSDYCAEAIGHWLDRQYVLAKHRGDRGFDEVSRWSQSSERVIGSAALGAPLAFARELLPRVARAADGPDRAAWKHRFGLVGEIIKALSGALRSLAVDDPGSLDDLVAGLTAAPPVLVDDLKIDAWAGNPDRYADRILGLLIDRQDLLGQPGAGRALSAGTRVGDRDLSAQLEQLLLTHAPKQERGRGSGHSQFRLLSHFAAETLSVEGTRRLEELRRKFGDDPPPDPPLVPRVEMSEVPPRIPDEATVRMSDENWLRAMRRVQLRRPPGSGDSDWDEVTLSRQLEARTKVEPERFASLAVDLMGDETTCLRFTSPRSSMDLPARTTRVCPSKQSFG